MMKLFCLFCLLLHASFSTQKVVFKHALRLQTDSSKLQIRRFNPAALNEYRLQREFKYEIGSGEVISFWDRFWNWFWNVLDHLLASHVTGNIINFVFILLGAGAIVLVILKLTGMDMIQIFTGKTTAVEIPYQESLENIHGISFEQEIDKAISSRNFRLAVRLLYLNCLKKLSDAGVIQWKADKTNLAYLHEIQNAEQQHKFGLLTRQFEYVWYGDFKIDQENFQQIRNSFQQFDPGKR